MCFAVFRSLYTKLILAFFDRLYNKEIVAEPSISMKTREYFLYNFSGPLLLSAYFKKEINQSGLQ